MKNISFTYTSRQTLFQTLKCRQTHLKCQIPMKIFNLSFQLLITYFLSDPPPGSKALDSVQNTDNNGRTNFNRGSAHLALFQSRHPSGQSLGALGQTSIKSCKSLNGGGGSADAVASDEK